MTKWEGSQQGRRVGKIPAFLPH